MQYRMEDAEHVGIFAITVLVSRFPEKLKVIGVYLVFRLIKADFD